MTHMWFEIGGLIAGIVAIVGIVIGAQRYNENKRSRIYQRLDDVKESIMDMVKVEYARKDICALTHSQVEKRLQTIEKQTALLPNIAAQLKILVNGRG